MHHTLSKFEFRAKNVNQLICSISTVYIFRGFYHDFILYHFHFALYVDILKSKHQSHQSVIGNHSKKYVYYLELWTKFHTYVLRNAWNQRGNRKELYINFNNFAFYFYFYPVFVWVHSISFSLSSTLDSHNGYNVLHKYT